MPEEPRSLGKVLRRLGFSKQERLKVKDGGKRQDGKVAPPVEHAPPSKGSDQTEPTIQAEQLWDQAYDDLKCDEPKLFNLYETILSHDLDSSKGAKGNVIEQNDRVKRRSQMENLLNTGLDNTAKLARAEKRVGNAMKIVLSVKEAISSGLQAVPIAALAWTGICVALEVFQNSIDETTTNREGIIQVVQNMKWYSSLSKLLLEETSQNDERFAEMRGLLASRILDLHKVLLKYIIQSICAYYRNPILQHLRDLVTFDDWSGSLDEVIKAEIFVKAAASDFGVRQANSYLGLLVNMHISKAQDEIMQKLCVTDMTAEIESLQKRKDHLLVDSYKWILDNQEYKDFTDWDNGNTKRLLWIKGDAGKGKTMLLIGIVTELSIELETHFDKSHLAYFFCQGTNDRLNTATVILRGLIWMLVRQQKSLIRHLDDFKDLGTMLFEAHAAFYSLKKILLCMLEDEALERAYLAVDALDECKKEEPGLEQLLEFISQISEKNKKVKWLVTSRNEINIERILDKKKTRTRLSLELNADFVAGAVKSYIDHKMLDLTRRFERTYEDYENSILEEVRQVQDEVADVVRRKADGTFLWVALVFRQIDDNQHHGPAEVLELVRKIPPGLNRMYDQMMRQIIERGGTSFEHIKRVLLTMVNTYRPLQLPELVKLAALPNLVAHQNLIRLCGLLTIKEDDKTVYFVHQSAKDYLIEHATLNILSEIFPFGRAEGHQTIVSQSLKAMTATLQRNIYDLEYPGFPITKVQAPHPDPLASIRYACVYWVDHLCEIKSDHDRMRLRDGGMIDIFLKEHFLRWLEALSLLKRMSEGVISIAKLSGLLMRVPSDPQLLRLVQDARRFILFNRSVIENSPLQAYASALMFSPTRSLIRDLYKEEEPKLITIKPAMGDEWSACLQTLEGHEDWVRSVVFSHDSTRLASASHDGTVKIWDADSGKCLQTLEGHERSVRSVVFSHDSTRLASASDDGTVKIWDADSGKCLQTLEGHERSVGSVVFSHDSTRLASASDDGTVKIWDADSGKCLQTLEGHEDWVGSVVFSHDSTRLASASHDGTVKIWDADSGKCLQTLEGHEDWVGSVVFSHDSTRLASASDDGTVKIWDADSGKCLQTLEGHEGWVGSVVFSHDSTRLASASHDGTVKIWDADSGKCLQTLEGHEGWVGSVVFSHDSTRLASASDDGTVKIWDADSGKCLQTLEGHEDWVGSVVFSHDSTRLASASDDRTVKIWDADSGKCLQTLEGHERWVRSVVFSHDSTRLASASHDRTVKIWDADSGKCLQTLEGHEDWVGSIVFSHDSTRLASASDDGTVKIWDVDSGKCLQTLEGHEDWVRSVVFSHDSTRLASASDDRTVKIWDADSGKCLQTLEGHEGSVGSVVFSHDSTRLASASHDRTVKIWDADSGKCLQTLEIGRALAKISFDTTNSYLCTDIGIIPINASSTLSMKQSVMDPQKPLYFGGALSSDGVWITYNSENTVWLPSEYRPSCAAMLGRRISVGSRSGKIWICDFKVDNA